MERDAQYASLLKLTERLSKLLSTFNIRNDAT